MYFWPQINFIEYFPEDKMMVIMQKWFLSLQNKKGCVTWEGCQAKYIKKDSMREWGSIQFWWLERTLISPLTGNNVISCLGGHHASQLLSWKPPVRTALQQRRTKPPPKYPMPLYKTALWNQCDTSTIKSYCPQLVWDSHFVGVFTVILDLQSICNGVVLNNSLVHHSLQYWHFLFCHSLSTY